jgi:hemolysin III
MMAYTLELRDPVSAGTHYMAAAASLAALPFIICSKAVHHAGARSIVGCIIFVMSMILLYTASGIYHTMMLPEKERMIYKKIDHLMIFILIAGSYTPICLTILYGHGGLILLACVWAIAIAGMIFKLFWVTCPKWVSSVIYISMGWLVAFAFKPLFKYTPLPGFILLLIGGLVYTLGGVIYALKLTPFNGRHHYFGSHEIFHVLIMVGNILHYIMVYLYC